MKSASYKRKPVSRSKKAIKDSKSGNNQVRIIGGRFKRQYIKFIDAQGLRPTPDRLRETLFNWLMTDLYDATVLDACAGSGVLGFEALSRGAAHVTFIEANQQQANCLKQSAHQLKLESQQFKIIHAPAQQNNHLAPSLFHIIFLDPPYALELWQPILSTLLTAQNIDSQTLIYIEDTRALEQTLPDFMPYIDILKQTHIGQITASLIQFHTLPNIQTK
ncbi:16S rRNA (guanine(966)-N(2))-methyltransferase RsmD [Psychrobacter sp. I-STPA6b]|uniref:16S rRNA (guanine(966)-N(2))-methyltransferase RsmD n=1 Tax=Psychrobacter sp. I-STPA6b TaxID=2585718 RepID=UPI001D0C43C5|nr:16S rRNA (guanine(966)-N(2))-methyltransferase RsmD [Psychrobacter sp. I-STPA6b]